MDRPTCVRISLPPQDNAALLSLFAATLGTVFALAGFAVQHAREIYGNVRLVRHKKSRLLPELRALDGHTLWHAFISHVWSTGQDQARSMKGLLREVLPGIRVFLDVDDLKEIGELERYIEATHVIIVFASRGYFESRNCLRELRAAVEQGKKIVFVCEADAAKGAVSLDEELLKPLGPSKQANLAIRDYLAPAAARRIEWQRVKPFLEVGLVQLAKELVDDHEISDHDPLELLGSVVSKMRVQLPRVEASAAHIYLSAHNDGALEFVRYELEGQPCFRRTPLRVSQTIDELHGAAAAGQWFGGRRKGRGRLSLPTCACLPCCGRRRRAPLAQSHVLLLYLDRRTWEGGAEEKHERAREAKDARRDALMRDVAVAMDLQMQVLLVHEMDGPQATPFATFLQETPPQLIEWGLYAEIAVAMHAGVYRPVAAHLLAAELAKLLAREPRAWDGARVAGGALRALGGDDDFEVAAPEEAGQGEDESGGGDEAQAQAAAAAEAEAVVAVAEAEAAAAVGDAEFSSPLAGFAEPYLEEGIIVHGVDDTGEMAVNPVQLQRMETQTHGRPKPSKKVAFDGTALPKAAGLPKPGSWARLGISVVAEDAQSKQVEQLKKLEKFLAKQQGVAVPTQAAQAAAHEHDLAEPELMDLILRSSKQDVGDQRRHERMAVAAARARHSQPGASYEGLGESSSAAVGGTRQRRTRAAAGGITAAGEGGAEGSQDGGEARVRI